MHFKIVTLMGCIQIPYKKSQRLLHQVQDMRIVEHDPVSGLQYCFPEAVEKFGFVRLRNNDMVAMGT